MTSLADMMAEIARLAPIKKHHLAPGMVSGRSNLTPVAAAKVLENLKACPDLEAPAGAPHQQRVAVGRLAGLRPVAFDEIPVGFYATPGRTGNNEHDFWKVQRAETGKWAGYTFTNRVLGGGTGGEQMRIVQVGKGEQVAALKAIIAAGIEESRMLFATKLVRCTDCGRDLTDDESVKYGKGRICREKNGV